MARFLCIFVLFSLVMVPVSSGMDHDMHGGHHGSAVTSAESGLDQSEAEIPASGSCVAESALDDSMSAHTACLGCCPPGTGTADAVSLVRVTTAAPHVGDVGSDASRLPAASTMVSGKARPFTPPAPSASVLRL